jgi:hypothetical protein
MGTAPLARRLWDRIDASGPCWLWTGASSNGYGHICVDYKRHLVHRFVYEMLVGPIPRGLTLDHLCRVPLCCNPDHLEPVTHAENCARSPWFRPTHCRKGHPLMNNTYQGRCLTCISAYNERYNARRRQARAS